MRSNLAKGRGGGSGPAGLMQDPSAASSPASISWGRLPVFGLFMIGSKARPFGAQWYIAQTALLCCILAEAIHVADPAPFLQLLASANTYKHVFRVGLQTNGRVSQTGSCHL